jgi:RND family efflux transporter MFP subunit
MERFLMQIHLCKFLTAISIVCMATSSAFAQDSTAPKVSVAAAFTKEVTDEKIFIGRGEAIDKLDVIARVSGFIDKIFINDGDLVKKGEQLFQVEADAYEATLEARNADLAQANANLDLTTVELKRKTELYRRQVGTQEDRDIAFANNQNAIAQVAMAKAAIKMAQLDVDYTQIYAPFDGRIGKSAVSVGQLVGPTSAPLINLVSITPIYVEFSLTEQQFVGILETHDISPNDLINAPKAPKVFVILPNGDELDEAGKVVFIDNRIDPTTGTIMVRAQFANNRNLILDGSFLNIRVQSVEPTKALIIPQASVQRDQRGSFVLVVGKQQTVEQRYITLGRQIETAVIVENGLQEGETVIVDGLQRVRPGVAVDPVLAGKAAGD